MMAKEDIVALIVKSDAVAALVLRIWRKQSGERATDLKTKTRVEIVQDDLGLVFSEAAAVAYLVREFYVAQLEVHRRTLGQQSDHHTICNNNNNVSKKQKTLELYY